MVEEKSEVQLSDCIEYFVQAVCFFILYGNWTLTHTYFSLKISSYSYSVL